MSRLSVIICGGASPVGLFSDQSCGGKKGDVASEVTRLFDLGFASDTDVHVDMTSTLGGDN